MTDEQAVLQKRRTAAEIEHMVAEFEASGLSRGQFCRSQGLALITLNRYLKRVHGACANDAARCELVPAELRGMNPGADREESGGLTVVLSGGRRIEVGAAFDAPTLQRLVQALEAM